MPGKRTVIECPGVPVETIEFLASALVQYGCRVVLGIGTPLSGMVIHPLSGQLSFSHDGVETLTIRIDIDGGHFPGTLMIGGIKQMVEEAAEDVRRSGASCG